MATRVRSTAAGVLREERSGHTLQPTALVHEAWLRLAGSSGQRWDNRGHFIAAAAEAMRRILIDNARRKHRVRHGQGLTRVDLDQVDVAVNADHDTLIALHEMAKQQLEILKGQDQVLSILNNFASHDMPGRQAAIQDCVNKILVAVGPGKKG